jgi:hypothetical protein|nr:MAG TPA: hypothetical protein [Caudoviricetes sp.]
MHEMKLYSHEHGILENNQHEHEIFCLMFAVAG